MQEIDEKEALETLGLAGNPSQLEIELAKKQLEAFWTANADDSHSIKELCKKMSARADLSYKKLFKQPSDTASGTATENKSSEQTSIKPETKSNSGLFWFLGIAAVVGLIFINISNSSHQGTIRRTDPEPDPPRPPIVVPQESEPNEPPEAAAPFVHSDIKGLIRSWTSSVENINGARRLVVRGRDAQGTIVNELIIYSNNGIPALDRQFIVRRDSSGLIIGVQRFVAKGGSALEFKDQRNVSPSGDVHSQTTFYTFDSFGKLQRVQVDTPFVKGFDGLTFDRSSGSLLVTRDRSPGQFSLNANAAWLDKFDMWDTYGQDN